MPTRVAARTSSNGKKQTTGARPGARPSRATARHPDHPIPKDVERAAAAAQAAREAAMRVRLARVAAARPTADERLRRSALIGKAMGVADLPAVAKGLRRIEAEYGRRVKGRHLSAADARILTAGTYFGDYQYDIGGPAVDHFFWWAHSDAFAERGLGVQFLNDGLHIFGNVSYDGDDLIQFSAGAFATFELQPNRRPASPSGRFNSEPTIDVFGTIDGWTGFYDWFWAADDKWCKCRLLLRQNAFQMSLGQVGELGDRTEVHTFINEENETRGVHAALPGAIKFPALQIGGAPNLSVFVTLEARFVIELEGDSFIGFSPNIPQPNSAGSVLMRFQQWEAIPV
jgi:hypothetical protein